VKGKKKKKEKGKSSSRSVRREVGKRGARLGAHTLGVLRFLKEENDLLGKKGGDQVPNER